MLNKKSNETLTKKDLIAQLIEKRKYKYDDAFKHVSAFIECFQELLSQGNHLKISYLGDFILQDKAARPGRSPKTGKAEVITARRVVKFHA